jgi:hypothetical protein
MRSLTLTALFLSCILLAGCGTIGNAKEMVAGLYEKYQAVEGKLSEVQGEMATARSEMESIHGALDSNGDGTVSLAERTAMIKDVAAGAAAGNQEDADLIKNPYFWAAIALGGPVAAGGAGAVARKVKKTVINPPAA